MKNVFFGIVMIFGLSFATGCGTTVDPVGPKPDAQEIQISLSEDDLKDAHHSALFDKIFTNLGAKSKEDVLINPYGFDQFFPVTTLENHGIKNYPETFSGYLDYVLGEQPKDGPKRLVTMFLNKNTGNMTGIVLAKKDDLWVNPPELYSTELALMQLIGVRYKMTKELESTPTRQDRVSYQFGHFIGDTLVFGETMSETDMATQIFLDLQITKKSHIRIVTEVGKERKEKTFTVTENAEHKLSINEVE